MLQLLIVKKYDRHEHSFMAIYRTITDEVGIDRHIFVVKDFHLPESSSSEPSSEPSSEESSSSSEESSSESSSSSGLYEIMPFRILLSIASLVDLEVYPLTPPTLADIYRADTVTILSNSQAEMEQLIGLVVEDVKINLALQRRPILAHEIVTLEDVAPLE